MDTSVLIDAFRGLAEALAHLAALRKGAGFCVSDVAIMEALRGCRDRRELEQTKAWFSITSKVAVSEAVSRRAVELVERHALSHRLQPADALIAATALEHGWPLCTLNDRHFTMIEGLTVLRPY